MQMATISTVIVNVKIIAKTHAWQYRKQNLAKVSTVMHRSTQDQSLMEPSHHRALHEHNKAFKLQC